jgi:hypothetical protein
MATRMKIDAKTRFVLSEKIQNVSIAQPHTTRYKAMAALYALEPVPATASVPLVE